MESNSQRYNWSRSLLPRFITFRCVATTGQDLAPTDATAQAPSAAEVSGLAAQLAGNAAITDQPSTSMVPDYTATDFSPPEAFIPTTASVPNKFDRNFLQKQQDLINSLGVTVNTGNAKVQTYLRKVSRTEWMPL